LRSGPEDTNHEDLSGKNEDGKEMQIARSNGSTMRRFLVALWVFGPLACTDAATPALTRLMEARRLTAELRVAFASATDAANRAVMADTDEASTQFANEARQATQTVQKDLDLLEPLVRGLDFTDETQLLATFRATFATYRALDNEVLGLAVENTNLKAQRLSFGPVREAADQLESALQPVLNGGARNPEALGAQALALRALLAVRQLQVLEAPHIAESDDAAMTRLEQQMATHSAEARTAIDELARAKEAQVRALVPSAVAALDKFTGIHAQIIKLSRRNSNVRSLALSLGEKRNLTGMCESSLRELSDQLIQRTFPATR
jgi:hypothetical protein